VEIEIIGSHGYDEHEKAGTRTQKTQKYAKVAEGQPGK
jgi:hypothetical protein